LKISFLYKETGLDESSDVPECCACGEARYRLTFQGTWSKETHSKDWPTNGY
jgi:hypothetical protein